MGRARTKARRTPPGESGGGLQGRAERSLGGEVIPAAPPGPSEGFASTLSGMGAGEEVRVGESQDRRDLSGRGGVGVGSFPQATPLTPIGQCGHCPPMADKGWIPSLAEALGVPWAGHAAPPGRGGCPLGSGREAWAEGGDPAVGRSLSSMRSRTRRICAPASGVGASQSVSRSPWWLGRLSFWLDFGSGHDPGVMGLRHPLGSATRVEPG